MVYEFYEEILASNFGEGIGGVVGAGILGFIIGLGIVIAILGIIAFYIYTSFAWDIIGRKLKYKNSWLHGFQ